MTERVKAVVMLMGEADGAIPNGNRIIKCNSEEGDMNEDGATGTVLSSIATPADMLAEEEFKDKPFFYFVSWDSDPGMPVGISSNRIAIA